jgi:hypothetical protein
VRHTTNSYILGSVIRLSATVKNLAGTAVDAAAVAITIKPQGGVAAAPVTPAHDGTGLYHTDWEPTASGTYGVRLVTTNPDSAAESTIYIEPTLLT